MYKYITPITNFDFNRPIKWAKVSKLKVKKITDGELLQYFGICNRSFDKNGRVTKNDFRGPDLINLFNFNRAEKYKLTNSKYAFTSDLDLDSHISEVKALLGAFRLFKLNGITCPITFYKETEGSGVTSPFESNITKVSVFSKSDLIKLTNLQRLMKKMESEDIVLLHMVTEQGVSTLSLVFLVIILERTIMKGLRGEISFKVRLYGSKLLSRHFDYNEKVVYETLKKAYDLRSGFVHLHKNSLNEVKEIFDRLYDYAVKVLRIKAEGKVTPDKLKELILSSD